MILMSIPVGLLLEGRFPTNGGMRTGNLILNGDMENIEWDSDESIWIPSLFTLDAETGTACVWTSNDSSPYAGDYDLKASISAITTGKTAFCYQEVTLNPGAQYDQLSLYHRVKITHREDSALEAKATVRLTAVLVLADGSEVTIMTYNHAASTDWQLLTKEFRPSLLTSRANIDNAVALRICYAIVPTDTVTPGSPYIAYVDDFTLEAEAGFSRNFSVGANIDWERDSAFERGNDWNRTMYQSSSGQGTAKRAGTIPFKFLSETQTQNLHGLWLYGARSSIRWWPMMATFPTYIDLIFERKWSFNPANANVEVGYSGSVGWMEA